MFLYLIFLLNIIIFTVIKGLPIDSTEIFPDLDSEIELEERLNRTEREDKLKHTAVCGELDRTEDTPFVAIITTRAYGRLLCMGSILDEYHVLTAKNCTRKSDPATLTVIAGYQSPYWGKNSQVKYVEKIIIQDKELAIIVLKKPFTITETVQPIRVIGPEKLNEKNFTAAYPPMYFVVGFEVPKSLEQADLVPKESAYHMVEEDWTNETECERCYDIVKDDQNIAMCTDGASQFGWGGMGSPVIVVIQKEFVLVGVVLKGQCDKPGTDDQPRNYPEIPYNFFTRTDRYYKWIKANSFIGR